MRPRPLIGSYDFSTFGGPALTPKEINQALDDVIAERSPPWWWPALEFFLATVQPRSGERTISVPGLGALYPYDYRLLNEMFAPARTAPSHVQKTMLGGNAGKRAAPLSSPVPRPPRARQRNDVLFLAVPEGHDRGPAIAELWVRADGKCRSCGSTLNVIADVEAQELICTSCRPMTPVPR